jgi:hypothetical protein
MDINEPSLMDVAHDTINSTQGPALIEVAYSPSSEGKGQYFFPSYLEQTLKGWVTTCLYGRGVLCTARRSYRSKPRAIRTKVLPTHSYNYWRFKRLRF